MGKILPFKLKTAAKDVIDEASALEDLQKVMEKGEEELAYEELAKAITGQFSDEQIAQLKKELSEPDEGDR